MEKGKDYWTQEALNSLEAQAGLKNILTWLDRQESLDKIAEVFGIKGTIKGLLQKTIDSDEEFNKVEFWFKNQTEIAHIIRTFDFSKKEIRRKAESLVITEKARVNGILISDFTDEDGIEMVVNNLWQSVSYEVMGNCLNLAKSLDIFVKPDDYQEIADNLLILANRLEGQPVRQDIIKIAYHTYKGLKENHGYCFRDQIIAKFKQSGGNWDRAVLKEAAKVVPNLKYKRQSWFDF